MNSTPSITQQPAAAPPTPSALRRVQEQVNQLLSDSFADKISQSTALSPEYGRLWQTMSDLSQAGGKRFRPYIVQLAYRSFGGDDEAAILPVAAAWELLHLCMLIHDDIIDNDYIRYGVDNVAGTYRTIYGQTAGSDARRDHYAMSAALLAGDLALSMAHELVAGCNLPAEQRLTAQRCLTAATFTVAGGELLDTEAALLPMQTANPRLVTRLKTASYSFVGPLRCGAELAGASAADLACMTELGDVLGHAFQLADDILGIFGDPAVTGKSATSDISEGKRTYLMQQTHTLSGHADQEILRRLVGKASLTQAEASTVRSIIERSGAKRQTEAMIDDNALRANRIIDGLHVSDDCRTELYQLVVTATKRNR